MCGDNLGGAVQCKTKPFHLQFEKYFCIFFSKELNSTLIGSCPYSFGGTLTKIVSELEDYPTFCGHLHRKGQLCGECEDNYTLPVYSYYLGCVKCKDFRHGWIKFIAAAFLPVTVFYIIVIMFRISATSSALNGLVLVSQVLAAPTAVRNIYSSNCHGRYETHISVDLGIAIYAIWNLDFFRSFYQPICLYPHITYSQVLMLDYAVAVYPLLLIFITFILVKLHDNFAFVVSIWKPFHKFLVLFRKQWNIQSNLVNVFATFIVLSYTKILNVSFEFLTFSHVYDRKGHRINRAYWYYDGTIDMTSKAYIPYLVLALFMLLIFNIFPLILLTLYPFRCFQVFLGHCFPSIKFKLALQIFMDAFHGCYQDTTHDYRHFAALYLAVRFFCLLLFSIFNHNLYLPALSLLLVYTLALVAKFQPYKCKRSNTVDMVMLLALVSGATVTCMSFAVGLMFPRLINGIIVGTLVLIQPGYILFLILAKILPKILQWFQMSKTIVLKGMKIFKVEVNVERQTLLNHGVADYNACY